MFDIVRFRNIMDMLHRRANLTAFTSHDFIGEYIKHYEYDYIEHLNTYRTPTDNRAFQTVNAEIGKFLSKHEKDLHIHGIGKSTDTNVHHTETGNEEWIFTD